MRKSARQSEKSAARTQQLQHLQRARRAALAQGEHIEEEEDNDEGEWHPDNDDDGDDSSISSEGGGDSPPHARAKNRGNIARKRTLDAMQAQSTNVSAPVANRREAPGVGRSSNAKDPRQRRQVVVLNAPVTTTTTMQQKSAKDPRQRRVPVQRVQQQSIVKVELPIYTDSSDEDEELAKKPKSILKRSHSVPLSMVVAPPPLPPGAPPGIGWAGPSSQNPVQASKPLTLHKRPNRQRQANLLRPVMTSTNALSQFYEDIMEWDFGRALVQDSLNTKPEASDDVQVPNMFESFEHYFAVWKPLAVEEVHAQTINGLASEVPPAIPIVTRTNVLATAGVSTMKVSLLINRGANPTKKHVLQLDDMRKDDLVLLTADTTYLTRRMKTSAKNQSSPEDLTKSFGILAIVDSQRSSRLVDCLVVVVTTKKWRELTAVVGTDSPIVVFKISNLVTSIREFRALCQCRDYKLMPLLLSGKAQPPTTKLDSLGMAYVAWLKKTFNESQQEAIAAAATSHGFTLIKGPPGTGKTTTLKGLLNSLHLREYNRYYNAVLDVARRPDHETSKAWAAIGDEKPHILVAAPSNIAVDNIVAKIMEEGFCDGEGRQYFPNIIRVGRGAAPPRPVALTTCTPHAAFAWLAQVQHDAVLLRHEFRAIIKWIHEYVDDLRKSAGAAPPVEATVIGDDTTSPPPILDQHQDALVSDTPAAVAVYRFDSEDEDAVHVPFSCDDVAPPSVADLDDEMDEPFESVQVEGDESDEVDEPFDQDDEDEVDEPLGSPEPPVSTAPVAASMEEGECSDTEAPPPPLPSGDAAEAPPIPSPSPPPSPPPEPERPVPPSPDDEPIVIDYNAYKQYRDMAQRINLCLERFHTETQDTLESSFLESAHIVFTTLSSAGHRALDDSTRYDILVIDEAAQAVELSTIIPMRHPTISAFPRHFFYGGILQDGQNVCQPAYSKMYHSLAPAFQPLVFFNLSNSREGMSSMSRSNPMEVKLAVNLYLTLRNSCPPDAIRGKVGVITPYAAQMDELKRAFAVACGGDFHQDVEINTVDGYQGREKDIIICNEAALQNSKPWAALLDHARVTGCLVHVPNPQENLFTLVPQPPGPPRGVITANPNRGGRGQSPAHRNQHGGYHQGGHGAGGGPLVHAMTKKILLDRVRHVLDELFVDVCADKVEFSALGDLFQDSHFRLRDSFVKANVFNTLPIPMEIKVAYVGDIRIEVRACRHVVVTRAQGLWGVMAAGSALRCTIRDSLFVFGAKQDVNWTDELQLRYAQELAVALVHRVWNRYHIQKLSVYSTDMACAILTRRALPPQIPVVADGMSKVVAIDGIQVYTTRIPTATRTRDEWKAHFQRHWPTEVHTPVLVPADIKAKVDLEKCRAMKKLHVRAVDVHVNQLNIDVLGRFLRHLDTHERYTRYRKLRPTQVRRTDVDPLPLVMLSFNVLPHLQAIDPMPTCPVMAPFPARAMWKYAMQCVLQDAYPTRRDGHSVVWLSKRILQYTDLYKRKMGVPYIEHVVRDLIVEHKQKQPTVPPVVPTYAALNRAELWQLSDLMYQVRMESLPATRSHRGCAVHADDCFVQLTPDKQLYCRALADRIIRQEFATRNAKPPASEERCSMASVVRVRLERLGRVHSIILNDDNPWNQVDVEAELFGDSKTHSTRAASPVARSDKKTPREFRDVMTEFVRKYHTTPIVHVDVGHVRFAFRHVDAANALRKNEWEFNCEFRARLQTFLEQVLQLPTMFEVETKQVTVDVRVPTHQLVHDVLSTTAWVPFVSDIAPDSVEVAEVFIPGNRWAITHDIAANVVQVDAFRHHVRLRNTRAGHVAAIQRLLHQLFPQSSPPR
ncbi:hypothetical protein DYB32_002218 [Aphanomyces invadans]|uniref:AAA+ ATPase domain-containing protein n=1 Tax=Aphanomyces invadans TaxID=157072 RepID=A0A3R6Z828_9STRA|nr:hypothetical protein DYB32_002218 [Aphanomyces invadans]